MPFSTPWASFTCSGVKDPAPWGGANLTASLPFHFPVTPAEKPGVASIMRAADVNRVARRFMVTVYQLSGMEQAHRGGGREFLSNRSFAVGIGLVCAAFALAQKVAFARAYRVGDKDAFQLSINGTGYGTPPSESSMRWTEEVVKVYKDGGADIKFTSSDFKMTVGGKPLAGYDRAEPASENMRVTKSGSPNELDDHNGIRISWIGMMLQGLAALKDGLAVGVSAK